MSKQATNERKKTMKSKTPSVSALATDEPTPKQAKFVTPVPPSVLPQG
jgi:hypothetical protein